MVVYGDMCLLMLQSSAASCTDVMASMKNPHHVLKLCSRVQQGNNIQLACFPVCRMQPLLHRFSKRIERALRAEAAAEAAEAAELEEAAFMAASSDDSSGDEQPLFRANGGGGAGGKAKKEGSLPPKAKSKLKLKLKVGGVGHPCASCNMLQLSILIFCILCGLPHRAGMSSLTGSVCSVGDWHASVVVMK